MPTLELSAGLTANLSHRLTIGSLNQTVITSSSKFALTTLLPYDFYTSNTNSGNEILFFLKIYSGTVPLSLNDVPLYNSRDDDSLIEFPGRLVNTFNENSVYTTNPVTINTDYVAASENGTATWFRLYSYRGSDLIHQIVGTIGLPESNADLEIGDVTIQQGELYKISAFRIFFPGTFVY